MARPIDASLVPLEKALLARALELSNGAMTAQPEKAVTEAEAVREGVITLVRALVADEFVNLAEALRG